ncbi:MAG: type 1 periplasmic binding fold superfamily protein [Fluviicola sp.]
MKTKTKVIAVLGLAVLAGFTSCKKDEDLVETPQPTFNEPEVITTMTLTFVDDAGVQPTVTATFRDPDGDGGLGADIFDTIRLQNNTVYNCSITLLNETLTPAEDMTSEVLEEDDEHLFCFTPSGADVSVVRTDSDGTYEVGIQSQWTVGAVGNGTTLISLKHQPGIKDGTCAPGETDIEVNFVTEVQ